MATQLSNPVRREINEKAIGQLLDIDAHRGLIVTMTAQGIYLRGKNRQSEAFVPWKKIVAASFNGMGLNEFRKELR